MGGPLSILRLKEGDPLDRMNGVYLPLVTPFYDGELDLKSLHRLLDHYKATGIAGFVLLGTTGEAPTVELSEQKAFIDAAIEIIGSSLPVYMGVGGNSTREVGNTIKAFERFDLTGYLLVTPYYNRPPIDGLIQHFSDAASSTSRPIIAYNVPYRTGINLPNDALLEIVATVPNVRAIKDATGNILQSLDLLERAPDDLAVLTGEDPLYFTSLANGAAGGILASAHLRTETFVDVADAINKEEIVRARMSWREISGIIPSLFAESNPIPLKYCLWRLGLLRSPECRLPLTSVSSGLAEVLDGIVGRRDCN